MVPRSPAPPPLSRRDRLKSWLRRVDRSGRRWILLLCGGVFGAMGAVLITIAVGLLLQPRFIVLELGAQRLVPDGQTAQPPIEQVDRYAAFDRVYTVRFDTPDGGLPEVVANAVRQRWRVVSSAGDGVVILEREGVRAVVEVTDGTTIVDTGVAPSVRSWQRLARIVALVVGAGGGVVWVWYQIRGKPRLRTVADPRR